MKNITTDLVTNYINGFYKPLDARLGEIREAAENSVIPIILKESEMFLKSILDLKKPKRVLEVGSAIGYSAIFFSLYSGCNVVTIERNEIMVMSATTNIREFGLEDKITLLEGEAEKCLANLQKQLSDGKLGSFDVVFLDAAKSHYKKFFDLSLPLLASDGLVVSDNILMRGLTCEENLDSFRKHRTNIRGMRDYIEYITKLEGFTTSLLAIGDGMAITTRNLS